MFNGASGERCALGTTSRTGIAHSFRGALGCCLSGRRRGCRSPSAFHLHLAYCPCVFRHTPHRDWAHPRHTCTGTGLTPATPVPIVGCLPLRALPAPTRARARFLVVLARPSRGHACACVRCPPGPMRACDAQAEHSLGTLRHARTAQRRIIAGRAGRRTRQGFPDWFEFSGDINSKYKQIANAVSPQLTKVCRCHGPHLRRDCAHRSHICTGTRLSAATFAPGVGTPLPQLHRGWAHPSPNNLSICRFHPEPFFLLWPRCPTAARTAHHSLLTRPGRQGCAQLCARRHSRTSASPPCHN